MKAYKQINLNFENRIVFGYAGVMCVLSFFILLSPVISQDNEPLQNNEPKIHYDLKKEFDKNGNLTGYDSTFTWYWSDQGFGIHDFDSLFEQFNDHFDLFDDDGNWSGVQPFLQIPKTDHFLFWNVPDSLGFYQDDTTLGKYRFNDSWSQIAPELFQWEYFFNDSIGASIFDFEDLSNYFENEESLKESWEHHTEFSERFREYQKEHQKLIEKYFKRPYQNNESEPKNEPQKLKSPMPNIKIKTGRV